MKVHFHVEEFDGHPHPLCGRGKAAVPPHQFEATAPHLRCKICDRAWFPNGQPQWHLDAAITAYYNDRNNGAHAAKAP